MGGIGVSEDEVETVLDDGDGEDDDGGSPPPPPPAPVEPPPPKRRRRRAEKKKTQEEDLVTSSSETEVETTGTNGAKQLTMEELESQMTAPGRLPKASENVKTLGGLVADYQIGQNPDWKLHLYRTYPRLFSGNRKADGFYVEIEHPIDEKWIAEEFGGGTYRVSVIGPHETSRSGSKQYASVIVNIGGPPREDRLPRSQVHGEGLVQQPGAPVAIPPPWPQPPTENPKLAEAALKMLGDAANQERQERHRVEERAETNLSAAKQMLDPIVDAEKRRADDIVRLEREKATEALKAAEATRLAERERFEEKMEALEARLADERQAMQDALRRAQEMSDARPSFGAELEKIIPLFKKDDDGAGAKFAETTGEMANKLLENSNKQHTAQIDAMRSSYEAQMASMRASQDQALQSLREAQQREMSAEREAWRHREQRYEDMLKAEREERRRDQDHARKQQEERDQTWKDRLETQDINLKAQWESRLATSDANHRERVEWMQREIDRRDSENRELRSAQGEKGDVVAQLHRAQEVAEIAKRTFGLSGTGDAPSAPAAPASPFADLDVNAVITEAFEKGPAIIAAFRNGGAAPAQQYYPGQIVQTKQGPMVVIATPEGLRLTPQAAFQQAQQARARPATPLLSQGGGKKPQRQQQRAPQPAQQQVQTRPRARKDDDNFEPVPNLAEGLPVMRAPWERRMTAKQVVGQTTGQPMPEQPPMPVESFAMPHPAPAEAAEVAEPISMNLIEKKIATTVADLVAESLSSGDEPHEFVQRVLKANYPDVVVHGLAGKSDHEIIAGVAQVAPGSAGTTTGGRAFIVESMAALRAALAAGNSN